MASTTGDGAEHPEPKAPAPTPPRPIPSTSTSPAAKATPAVGFGPPVGPASAAADGGAADAAPVVPPPPPSVPILAIPPVAVPKVRNAPPTARSIKGETTASDYVAPRELPAHTPRPTESVDAKVVIDVPDGAAGAEGEAEVALMRQRRRAPTMKIDRSKINQLKNIEGARERAADPDPPAVAVASREAPSRAAPAPLSGIGPAGLGIEAPRQLARAAPEPRSPRSMGWAVVALATVVVGGVVAAIVLGLIPGLGPTASEAPEARPAAMPTSPAAPTEAAAAPTAPALPSPEASTTAAPASEPLPRSPSAAPPATTPAAPPQRTPTQGGPRPGNPYPKGRPRSDIPQGI